MPETMETMTPAAGRLQATIRFTSFTPELQQAEAFRRQVAQWFYAAAQCRLDIVLAEGQAINRDLQRGTLSSLIAWGEWAQLQIEKERIDLSPIGVSPRDVAAETRILRDTFRSAFDNCFTKDEANNVLAEVFG